jgi:hypothetical protein
MERQIKESHEIYDINKLEYWNLNSENLITKFVKLEKENNNLVKAIRVVVDKNNELEEENTDLKLKLQAKEEEIQILKKKFKILEENNEDKTNNQSYNNSK